MKTLHDATKVSDATLTKVINGEHHLLTPEEQADADDRAAEFNDRMAAYIAAAPDRKRAEIKAEAGKRILTFAPEWKQRNILRRGLELLRKGEAKLSAGELAEAAAMENAGARIDAIRAASDGLEASLAAMTADELATFEPASDSHWPRPEVGDARSRS